MVNALNNKIKGELSQICSTQHNSILATEGESIQNFSWNTIWIELKQKMPVFLSLLSAISSQGSQMVHCVMACTILKKKHQKMGLLQKIVSVFLYANAVPKQV